MESATYFAIVANIYLARYCNERVAIFLSLVNMACLVFVGAK